MQETLVWHHMEINNNTFIRQAENLLSKILTFKDRENTNKQQQESSKMYDLTSELF